VFVSVVSEARLLRAGLPGMDWNSIAGLLHDQFQFGADFWHP
jgi:hypothetical protein